MTGGAQRKILLLILFFALPAADLCCRSGELKPGPGQEKPPGTVKGEGQFDWQFPDKDKEKAWHLYSYDEQRWWGTFPKNLPAPLDMFTDYPWAVGPFVKHASNPVLSPTPGSWDPGRHGGGVHNGAVVIKEGVFYYVYRGERPLDMPLKTPIDYICDIGIATGRDGVRFVKDTRHSPIFRRGQDRRFSYEDVNLVKWEGTYYLFCNQWYWPDTGDLEINGTFLAISEDLLNWNRLGIVFPAARRTHRNAVVLQNGDNEAVKVDGRFVMYINDGLMAYSSDMRHWESRESPHAWPGGEGCFALADHDPEHPERIILFTGGNHTGHFYAAGQVLFSKSDPEKPLAYLPRPFLAAETSIPWENGFSADDRRRPVSSFADCIFFNGLTRYRGKWWLYYGGSEYFTCLATAAANNST
jgi:predicted GH43/DUF377 family glycosyl hydrolase